MLQQISLINLISWNGRAGNEVDSGFSNMTCWGATGLLADCTLGARVDSMPQISYAPPQPEPSSTLMSLGSCERTSRFFTWLQSTRCHQVTSQPTPILLH